MKATIVFEKNWDAIHKSCEACGGTGYVDDRSCYHCGSGEKLGKSNDGIGSGKQYKYIINKGSSRSSKTWSLIHCYDHYARSNSNKRLTVWRDTKTDCKKTVLSDMLKWLKLNGLYKNGHDFNKTESIFTYTTDSTVEIHGTDDEETVHGLTQDAAWLNEPYKISRETFNQIDQRTSDFIFIDYNPKKGHWVEDLVKDKKALVIHSTFKDNPFCPAEQKAKILSYQPVSYCNVVMSGLISEMEVSSYDLKGNPKGFTTKQLNELLRCIENEEKNSASVFNWQVYGLGEKSEKPNRIFKWKSIPLSEYMSIDSPIYIGVDWGVVDPWGVLEAKYVDGNLYLRELNYASENDIRSKLSATELLQIRADDSDETAREGGIVAWLFNKLGIDRNIPVICDTNRPLKIAMLRRKGWNSMTANKPKGSIVDGIDLLNNLNVFYTSESKNIEYEQENYSRKIDKYGEVEEEPEDKDNHLIDPARYVALYLQIRGIIKVV